MSIFYYGVTILSYSLLVISLLFGYYNYSNFSKAQKWYLRYLGFIFIIELTSRLLIAIGTNNLWVYPFYVLGEFVILSTMFIKDLQLSRKMYILVLIASIFLFSESIFLWISNQNVTSGKGKIFSHLMIISLAAYFLIRSLKTLERERRPRFLIIYAGLFLCYSVSLILFLLLGQLTNISKYNASIIWGLNNISSSILYGASIFSFLKVK
jgi:hypothetical protein